MQLQIVVGQHTITGGNIAEIREKVRALAEKEKARATKAEAEYKAAKKEAGLYEKALKQLEVQAPASQQALPEQPKQ